ncbi:MAG TPA: pyridoxamine 5'-phosphate oxidase family protein [Planctomycetota bacterium]|nr:pyridoxamine 5'-phosphate oxidase family protein [Planctomycetota bacterium]
MAGTGPREMTREAIDALLKRAVVAHLAMVDGVRPYAVPVNFGYDRECLYFRALRIGRKVAVLRANPRVSFVVGEGFEVRPGPKPGQWQPSYRTVCGEGVAEFVESRAEKIRAFDSLLGKFSQGPFEYSPRLLDDALIVRVRIESLSGRQAGK